MVLETVNDYVLYDIEPPVELRTEWLALKKQQNTNNICKQNNKADFVPEWKNFLTWYAKDFHATSVFGKDKSPIRPQIASINSSPSRAQYDQITIDGAISNEVFGLQKSESKEISTATMSYSRIKKSEISIKPTIDQNLHNTPGNSLILIPTQKVESIDAFIKILSSVSNTEKCLVLK